MITCPTCANRMVIYGSDWCVCLACSVFDRATPDPHDNREPEVPGRRVVQPVIAVAQRETVGAWQA